MNDFVVTAVLLAVGLGWVGFKHFRSRSVGPEVESADFVTFRTSPALLPMLTDDKTEAGWALANTYVIEPECLYRFEKMDSHAAALPLILGAKGVMQRIANRQIGADVVLTVEEFGARKSAHA